MILRLTAAIAMLGCGADSSPNFIGDLHEPVSNRRRRRQPAPRLVQPQARDRARETGAAGVLVQAAARSTTCRSTTRTTTRNPAESVKRLKSEISGRAGPAVRHARIQPLDARRAEERDRPRVAPVWPERLGGQAGRRASAFRSAPSARRWRNSTCATCSPTWTCRRSASPKPSSRPRRVVRRRPATSAADSRKFLQGWMDRYVAWVKKHAG